ncbi:MAG: phosphatidate cytidylyltransferase, partial [Planctomycetota bacterium]
ILLAVMLGLLGIAFFVGRYLHRQPNTTINKAVVQSFNNRVSAWWLIYALIGFTLVFCSHRGPATLFFFFVSFWALREFITLTPTRLGDHRALFWTFFIFAPLQYLLVGLGTNIIPFFSYDLNPQVAFMIVVPVYAMLYIPARIAFAGDPKRFLERVAKIQCGLYVCVYALSHAPALLAVPLVDQNREPWTGGNGGVLLFFIIVVQMGDVFQYLWSYLLGSSVIAPAINSSKTWEGLIGSMLSATLLGMAIHWVTPFSILQAGGMAMIAAFMGFAGSLTLSAIKRDRGVSDYGTLVAGHVGVLDRYDSICFAAPVFYHLTYFFFSRLNV